MIKEQTTNYNILHRKLQKKDRSAQNNWVVNKRY